MNTNNNNISIVVNNKEDEYIESYLLSPPSCTTTHTLVLDIDETLLSVRRWIDEIQINDIIYSNKLSKHLNVIKITKEVTLQYDDGQINVYSFYFNPQQPFGQLKSSLDIGDRMDIGQRLASVKEVFTSYITIYDSENDIEIEVNCMNDGYLDDITYCSNKRDNKFSVPDLVYNNLYLVRFRNGLDKFFNEINSYKNLEIVLWTAAVRKVYTNLMKQVEQILLKRINNSSIISLWSTILFRDNCSQRENGSYFKDLSLLNRPYNKLIMIDNISYNFEHFEYNGLPINEYWGHSNDNQLYKLIDIINGCVISSSTNDIRNILHSYAYKYDFSTFKLNQMISYLKSQQIQSPISQQSHSQSNSQTPPPLEVNDELMDINMELQSQETNIQYESEDCTDSTPTSIQSDTEPSEPSSQSLYIDEDNNDKLDFYLFNFNGDLDNIQFDDDLLNDIDVTSF